MDAAAVIILFFKLLQVPLISAPFNIPLRMERSIAGSIFGWTGRPLWTSVLWNTD